MAAMDQRQCPRHLPGMVAKRPSSPARGSAKKLTRRAGRRAGETRWLERQINDPYVGLAKKRGLRSRAAFKLEEIDAREKLLRPGLQVVDLGAAPGGWSQIASGRVGDQGTVIAIDLQEIDPITGVTILRGDFLTSEMAVREALGGQADLVLSDMAAPTVGHRATDHLRTLALAEAAAEFAIEVLKPGGDFLCKLFQGGETRDLLVRLKRHFRTVKHIKPPSSRKESVEMFVLARGLRAGPEDQG